MNPYLAVVACVLSGLAAVSNNQAGKNLSKDEIRVQVTGMLGSGNTVGAVGEGGYSGAVFAKGHHFFLDCKHNKKAEELLRKEYADLAKHTGFIPGTYVHVTGHLQFVPYELCEKGKQSEHRDRLVIVVESVKVVK